MADEINRKSQHVSYPRRLELTLLFLATIAAGLAEGYFLYPMGLDWLLPAMLLTAIFVVLIAREWLTR
jgi:hypothetical protein